MCLKSSFPSRNPTIAAVYVMDVALIRQSPNQCSAQQQNPKTEGSAMSVTAM